MISPGDIQVVIIGGGPAGLTAAYELSKSGVSAVVLEKDEVVGGLARTINYKNYHFDIGGHRFFTKVEVIERIWREVLGEDLLQRNRLSRIYYNRKFFHYPIRPVNALLGLGVWNSMLILASYVYSQMFPEKPEENFEQWISNRFGERLYRIFFKTYTEKVWGIPCREIKAEWAAQRIRGLSLASAIKNSLFKSGDNIDKTRVIKTLIDTFHYPKLGPGMIWQKTAKLIKEYGNEVRLGAAVERVYWKLDCVAAVEIKSQGEREIVSGTHFISSMPIKELFQKLSPSPPEHVINAANGLNYRDFLTTVLIVDKRDVFPDNWIYIHDPGVKLGRIQNFKNWSPHMVPDPNKTCLGLEYFCFEGDGLWTMADRDLLELGKRELQMLGLVEAKDVEDGVVVRVPKAYPIYDTTYREHLATVKQFLKPISNLQLVGRNGMHTYNNQDHAMLTALLAAQNILGANHDLWKVNVDQEYHEEIRGNGEDEEVLLQVAATQPRVPERITGERNR